LGADFICCYNCLLVAPGEDNYVVQLCAGHEAGGGVMETVLQGLNASGYPSHEAPEVGSASSSASHQYQYQHH
jgi:hypothetical protein